MFKITKKIFTITVIISSVVMWSAGCGGGPLSTGGMGPFAPKNLLPDEKISIDNLPPSVKTKVEAEISGKKLESVIRNARPRDGRWYYTITYSDKHEGTKLISFWHDGSLRPLQD